MYNLWVLFLMNAITPIFQFWVWKWYSVYLVLCLSNFTSFSNFKISKKFNSGMKLPWACMHALQHDLISAISSKTLLPHEVTGMKMWASLGEAGTQFTSQQETPHVLTIPQKPQRPQIKHLFPRSFQPTWCHPRRPPVAPRQGMENNVCVFLRRLAGGSWYVSQNTAPFFVLPVDKAHSFAEWLSRDCGPSDAVTYQLLTSISKLRWAEGPKWQWFGGRPDFLKKLSFQKGRKKKFHHLGG